MDIALLVGLCLLTAIAIGCIAFAYSYFIYTRNRLFTKAKFPIMAIVVLGILFICLIICIILIGLNINKKPNPYMPAYLGLSITLLVFNIAYIIFFIYAYVFNNKNKIEYTDIPNIDWKQKEADLLAKIDDMEAIKAKLSSKNLKYYTSMLEYYKSIVSRLSDNNLPISEILADIVTFNDSFTHKWCSKLNAYQLQLTYKFCMVFEKKSCQK